MRVLQENKTRRILNVRFSENLACFFFLETPVLRFALFPYNRRLQRGSKKFEFKTLFL